MVHIIYTLFQCWVLVNSKKTLFRDLKNEFLQQRAELLNDYLGIGSSSLTRAESLRQNLNGSDWTQKSFICSLGTRKKIFIQYTRRFSFYRNVYKQKKINSQKSWFPCFPIQKSDSWCKLIYGWGSQCTRSVLKSILTVESLRSISWFLIKQTSTKWFNDMLPIYMYY